MEINEREKITRLHKGDCAFIRKDFGVQLTKQAYKGEQFKAIFLMFTTKFLRDFYSKMDKNTIPEKAKRSNVSLRSIQMYEQRNKDINKASAETVLSLAKVLGCTMEDLLET